MIRDQWARVRRPVTFAAVGAVCLGVQCGILLILEAAGIHPTVANAVGFVASAQLNFVLSNGLTWSDRPVTGWRQLRRRWVAYQLTVVGALLVNMTVFAVVAPVLGSVPGALMAVVIGTVVTFTVNHFLVFNNRAKAAVNA